MNLNRRGFFSVMSSACATLGISAKKAGAAAEKRAPEDAYGCLVDLTRCLGCRKCEEACNLVNQLPEPAIRFDDLTVLDHKRRPDEKAFTVVNRYFPGKVDDQRRLIPTYVKIQCMHCGEPACASACIVGALEKKDNGSVYYDVGKCIGCRYCMVACPFEIPAYEYHDPLTPKVMKCTFCFERISKDGGLPGCASVCPVEAITFGKRKTLLKIAREKIKKNPSVYIDHIYGEKEVGGTSWMYISGVPFEKLGFISVPDRPTPKLAETVQHTFFSYLWSPILLFGLLSGIMWTSNKKHGNNDEDKGGEG